MATAQYERNIPTGTFTHTRKDNWWVMPIIIDAVIILFVIYTILAVFYPGTDKTYQYASMHYYSPIWGIPIPKSVLDFLHWPGTLPLALLTIWAPLGFRASCYYERKIYYRDFFTSPPACGVNGIHIRRGKYTGERAFPFILNNLHRWFFYVTLILMILQTLDFLYALTFGIGVGTIILFFNTLFLSLYVYSCHAFRHVVGGNRNCYDCGSVGSLQFKGWKIVSKLNENHSNWFWISLGTVMLADFWIRLVAGGVIGPFVFIRF